MNLEFTQKEKDIFEGVLTLARKGDNICTLKVQQIADAVQIGKSTLYEYFSSREEILAKALIYSMNTEMKEFEQVISDNNSFMTKITASIDFVHDSVLKNSSSFTLFSSAMQEQGMREILCEQMTQKDIMLQKLVSVLNTIVVKGRAENLVDKHEDDVFCNMALISALCTVMFTTLHSPSMSWDTTRANTIKMLCKTLA